MERNWRESRGQSDVDGLVLEQTSGQEAGGAIVGGAKLYVECAEGGAVGSGVQ